MALSGSISGSYSGWTVRSDWSASQSIGGNYSDITVNHYLVLSNTYSLNISSRTNYCTVNGEQKSFTSGSINQRGGTVYLGTTSYRVGHNADGAKSCDISTTFNVKATLSGTYKESITASGTITLNTIPRQATVTSAQDFNDTGNPVIGYNNSARNNVTTLQACIASSNGQTIYAAYRDISKTGSSYTFNLTSAERSALLAATPNSNTLAVRFYIKTVLSGNTYYSYLQKTMTVVDANPTFSAAYKDTNSAIVAVTENDQLIVQNKSTLQINVTNASAKKSATLTTATCVLNGTTYSGNISGSSYSFNIGVLDISSNATAKVTVADSRGNTTSTELTIQMIAYFAPSAIVTAQRENNYYANTTINVDANYASVDGKNSIQIKVRYKKASDSSWSNYVTFQDNVPQTISLDNGYEWYLQAVIIDLYSTVTYNLNVSRGMPLVYFDRLKNSVGINCFPSGNSGVYSEDLQLDSNICVGSQVLYDAYVIATLTSVTILSAYNYDLINGLFGNLTLPDGYETAIRISAQVSTTNANTAKVSLNNLETSTGSTYSNNNYRKIITSDIMKVSDLVLEPTVISSSRDGLNLELTNGGSATGNAYFYNITLHGYIVKSD